MPEKRCVRWFPISGAGFPQFRVGFSQFRVGFSQFPVRGSLGQAGISQRGGWRMLACGLVIAIVGILAAGRGEAIENRLLTAAASSITSAELQAHVDVLSDDTFEGREAGSRGSRAAAGYLIRQFERLGVGGGGEDGGYVQNFQGRYRNLLVRIEGSDPDRRQETILLGAHYDHVGYGNATNSYGPTGYIHNGADDNASGTSALLEVIEAFAKMPQAPARTVLFAFWDGEEKGLLGSKHWTAHPTLPLDQVALAINVDMVGRLRGQRLSVFGTRTSPGLRQFVSRQNVDGQLELDFTWEIEANSDHYSFFERKIPFLMLHTGLHDDYHRPSDDAEKVNSQGLQQISRLMFQLAYQLADRPAAYPFRANAHHESESDRARLDASLPQPAPRLGLSWNAEQADSGELRVTRVTAGSPAERAGVRVGDTVVAVDGRPFERGLAFQQAVLAAEKSITLTIQRPGEPTPRELPVPLNGSPYRLGISWREDAAEPGSVIVKRVVLGTAAHEAGLRAADRILEVNGQTFENGQQMHALATAPQTELRLLIERRGKLREVTLQLGEG